MVILGIDAAKHCGISVVKDGKVIMATCFIAKGKDYDYMIADIKKHIEKLLKAYKPDYVILENVYGKKNLRVYGALSRLNGVLRNLFIERNQKYIVVEPSKWRAKLDINKKGDKKLQAMKYASEYIGEEIKDDNIADAVSIGVYGYMTLDK